MLKISIIIILEYKFLFKGEFMCLSKLKELGKRKKETDIFLVTSEEIEKANNALISKKPIKIKKHLDAKTFNDAWKQVIEEKGIISVYGK